MYTIARHLRGTFIYPPYKPPNNENERDLMNQKNVFKDKVYSIYHITFVILCIFPTLHIENMDFSSNECIIERIFNKYHRKSVDFILKKLAKLPFDCCMKETDVNKKLKNIQSNIKKIDELKKIPEIVQRSDEWFKVRDTLITASDMGQALGVGKFGSVKDFYIKKSGYIHTEFPKFPALEWGVKYEPVATRLYEVRQRTNVIEFGLLKHPMCTFFGASPDGITETGTMLEIKCPYSRTIDGKIVDQYFYQMQGQLDVCNLDNCDFLECTFHEYIDDYAFHEDWDNDGMLSKDGREKGAIIITGIEDNKYIYSDVGLNKEELNMWLLKKEKRIKKSISVEFYKVKQFHLQRVVRDKVFFTKKLGELAHVWNNVCKYKQDKSLYDKDIGEKIVRKRPVKCLFVNVD